MKLTTLISLIFVSMIQIGQSQTEKLPDDPEIVLKSLPQPDKGYKNLGLSFCSKGIYHFVLDKTLEIPEGYTVVIKDPITGREIFMTDSKPCYFTVSQPVNKNLRISLRKDVEIPRLSQSLVVN